MNANDSCCVLTINSGSSSLKFSVYQMGPAETLMFSGSVERIGLKASRFHVRGADGKTLVDEHRDLPDHDAACAILLDWLQGRLPERRLEAVGHRVVHGGPQYNQPHPITPELLATLETLVRLAPEHLPHELLAIRALERRYPALRQVACFDTAFHRHMPEVAQRYPMPRSLWQEGVRRYGFHGLSYEYILQKLAQEAGREAAAGRVIVAHLGNGASMAAIRGGVGIDTTMGLTPAGGLMMGTRSGDLDPGVLLYLLREKGRSPSTLDYLVNQRAGLIGVSGTTSDMRDLLRAGGRRSPRCRGHRTILLPGAKTPRGAGRRAGWSGYVGLHGRRRRKCPRDPRPHLPRAGVLGHPPRHGPQRSQCAGHQPRRQPGHGPRAEDRRGVDDRPAHVQGRPRFAAA